MPIKPDSENTIILTNNTDGEETLTQQQLAKQFRPDWEREEEFRHLIIGNTEF